MIVNNLRVIMAKKKITLTDMHRSTGLSRNTLAALYYERSKGIQFKTLEVICEFLKCEVSELFEHTNDKKEAI